MKIGILMVGLFILILSVMALGPTMVEGSPHWVADQTIYANTTVTNNWTIAQTINVNVDSSNNWTQVQTVTVTANTTNAPEAGPYYNWLMVIIWLVVLWLPALLLGYLVPGYGTFTGLILMGVILCIGYPTFLMVLFVIIINGVFVFWRGVQ